MFPENNLSRVIFNNLIFSIFALSTGTKYKRGKVICGTFFQSLNKMKISSESLCLILTFIAIFILLINKINLKEQISLYLISEKCCIWNFGTIQQLNLGRCWMLVHFKLISSTFLTFWNYLNAIPKNLHSFQFKDRNSFRRDFKVSKWSWINLAFLCWK